MEYEVPNMCDDISDYEDIDHMDGEHLDLLTFFANNEFYSVYEQVEENIDVNTSRELEEVQVKDVEMNKDDDIDHSNTKEALQWSSAKDPLLVVMELDDQSSPHSMEMEFEVTSTRIHMLVQVDAHGVVLGLYLAIGKHFKSELVGYYADDDDGLELWMLLMKADLKHGLVHVVSFAS
nr:hypothetical protein [Tanacetum cinerariifolium]